MISLEVAGAEYRAATDAWQSCPWWRWRRYKRLAEAWEAAASRQLAAVVRDNGSHSLTYIADTMERWYP